MFEQEIQNQGNDNQNVPIAANQNSPKSDLFNHYEIRSWDFSSRLYKILAGSAILNIAALLLVGQSHLLTTKGCDSPFVSSICQVLDTVYVGSRLMSGNNEFEVKEYDKTSIEDADITYIDASGKDAPLYYPDDYFAIANPEQTAMNQPIDEMGMPSPSYTGNYTPPNFSMPPSDSISTVPLTGSGSDSMGKPVLPPPNPNAVQGAIPSSPFGNGGFSTIPKSQSPRRFDGKLKPSRPMLPNSSPRKLPDFDSKTAKKNPIPPKPTPEPTPEVKQPELNNNTDAVAEAEINKKPLQDFGNDVLDKVTAKTIDLSKPFLVVMQGAITKDGKLDRTKSKFIKQQGDAEMINVAKSAIEAIGDSGLLDYLKRLNVEKVNFTLVQDDKQIYALISSDQPSESTARTISSGLNAAIAFGKNKLDGQIKESATPADIDTLAVLKAATVESQGKSFVLKFNLDKPIAQDLINRQLQKAQAKRQEQQQPNGTIATKPIQNAGK